MNEADKEEAMIMAWNHVYRDLKHGSYQQMFDEDNPPELGPVKKGNYRIENGRLQILAENAADQMVPEQP